MTREEEPEGDPSARVVRAGRRPRLGVLYHCDPTRIGEWTELGAFPQHEGWLSFGRLSPRFFAADRMGSQPRPIEDRYISRSQFDVRYIASAGEFEVRPNPDARRALLWIQPGSAKRSAHIYTLTHPRRLPTGSLLAVSDRLLLVLTTTPEAPRSWDRMGFVGESAAMWRLRDEIGSIASFQRPSLVLGPTGAGKELVARAVHSASTRSTQPLVFFNCAAISHQLAESTLFGHRKGAFTGATTDSAGLFRSAEGGSLVLDEFGELEMQLQAKLLRVLQDGQLTPVGQTRTQHVDVRVIALTNREPEEEIARGTMRADLYYRMAAHVLRVPALRDRFEDIPALLVHFFNAHLNTHPSLAWLWTVQSSNRPAFSMTLVLGALLHTWPGNVRELQNFTEHIARLNLHPPTIRYPDDWKDDLNALSTALHNALKSPTPPPQSNLPQDITTAEDSIDSPPPSPPLPTEVLRPLSHSLKLAQKTLRRILIREDLPASCATWNDAQWDAHAPHVHTILARRLFDHLHTHNFNQSQAARTWSMSRTTLQKLMVTLHVDRIEGLDVDRVRDVWIRSRRDPNLAAHTLRLSPERFAELATLHALSDVSGDDLKDPPR